MLITNKNVSYELIGSVTNPDFFKTYWVQNLDFFQNVLIWIDIKCKGYQININILSLIIMIWLMVNRLKDVSKCVCLLIYFYITVLHTC